MPERLFLAGRLGLWVAIVGLLAASGEARQRVRCFVVDAPFERVVAAMGRPENEAAIYRALRVEVIHRRVNPKRLFPRIDVGRTATVRFRLPSRCVVLACREVVRLEEDRFVIRSWLDRCHWKVRGFRFEVEVTRAGQRTRVVLRLELALSGLGRRIVERWGSRIVLRDVERTIRAFVVQDQAGDPFTRGLQSGACRSGGDEQGEGE